MSIAIQQRFAESPIVPLVQARDPEVVVQTANALAAGGIKIVEAVFGGGDSFASGGVQQ